MDYFNLFNYFQYLIIEQLNTNKHKCAHNLSDSQYFEAIVEQILIILKLKSEYFEDLLICLQYIV